MKASLFGPGEGLSYARKFIIALIGLCVLHASFAQNPIVTENLLPGNPASEWDISGAGSSTLQGFAADISVNPGSRIDFKINTSTAFTFDIRIYRLGYYQGNGARLVSDLGSYTGTIQPAPVTDVATGLVDCGNWLVSAFWDVPTTAVSGVYVAKLTRTSNSTVSSHIVFVVRNDASTSDLYFKTSDATWQAYNSYGGNSLYTGVVSGFPAGHAPKVSYNRPFITRDGGGGGGPSEDWLFNAEYPMIRFLEQNGYDISYTTDVDAARYGNLITNHKVFLSVGHDEYWSGLERSNVEAARNSGVNLAFFSGNETYWKTRWEPSIDGSNTDYRTLVCYKEGTMGENVCGGKCDPSTEWTGLWRDGCSYPAGGACSPENALTGTISWRQTNADDAMTIPSMYRRLRIWKNTSVATLADGQSETLTTGTLGFEWDFEQFNDTYPPGRITMSSTSINGDVHRISMYRHNSGSWVFSAGTCQWSWGLDSQHDRGNPAISTTMRQATINILAEMETQPATLMTGLVPANTSTDFAAPSASILSPVNGKTIYAGSPVTLLGTATDAGGGVVAGMEISLDGGTTWRSFYISEMETNISWNYQWTPGGNGSQTIMVRGYDDSGNMGSPVSITFNVTALPDPNSGPGGPILVIGSSSNPFSKYTAEILRAEGLNEFSVADINTVDATILNNYDVVILGEMPVSAAQASLFTTWADNGGTFIAFRPDPNLYSLLGISSASATLSDQYYRVEDISGPGKGIVHETIQYHGLADLYNLNGAALMATLYSDATTALPNPAMTVNSRANGGSAVAFAFDVCRSIIYTRQGNPAWAGQKRDGQSGPIRSDDLFFGGTSPDWIDFNKVAIPQADELQRLLANTILVNNLHRMPLPRTWYLPKGLKAAIVMSGDDHANNGTPERFDTYQTLGPNSALDVANWDAVRGTSYLWLNTPIGNGQASLLQEKGFEIALHLNTDESGCENFTPSSYLNDWNTQGAQFATNWPDLEAPLSNRTHCLAWSDWASQPKGELQNGVRIDLNYYYWPEAWMLNRPGMFTGSGMPMRFADLDGSMIDVYQLTTQMTDETNMDYSLFCNTLLDKALGPEGYYGAFCANMHTDFNPHTGSEEIINSALAHNVPVISARQMLMWLDGRNNSSFTNFQWQSKILSFTAYGGAYNMKGMVPVYCADGQLLSVSKDGNPIPYAVELIKGIQYAFFDIAEGTNDYLADYNAPPLAPTITQQPASATVCEGSTITFNTAAIGNPLPTVQWQESSDGVAWTDITGETESPLSFTPEMADNSKQYRARWSNAEGSSLTIASTLTINESPVGSILSNGKVCEESFAKVTFNASSGVGPFQVVVDGTTYNNISSGDEIITTIRAGDNSLWDNAATPTDPVLNDGQPVEVGVKFKSAINGSIRALKFYKGAAGDGSNYVLKLWRVNDQSLLTSVSFSNAAASGWQIVDLPSPVTITANTIYIVSYYSAGGNYANTDDYFINPLANGQLTAIKDGTEGEANGVYTYGSGFPTQTYHAANYWADVIFVPSSPIVLNLTSITAANGCNVTGNLGSQSLTISACAPLPVMWLSFTAQTQQNNVLLKWSTAQEQNNKGFEVERSTDGARWTEIAFVNGVGNSELRQDYTYLDMNLSAGKYYYRLRQVDLDGKFDYSKTVSAEIGGQRTLALFQNHPNPFSTSTRIDISIPGTGRVRLLLYDVNGRPVRTLVDELRSEGTYSVEMGKNGLSAGVYYYRLEFGGETRVMKMTIF